MNKYDVKFKRKFGEITSSVALATTLAVSTPVAAYADSIAENDENNNINTEQINDTSITGVFDTKEKAQIAKEEAEKELKEAGYTNITSEIKEIPAQPINKTYESDIYATEEEAQKNKQETENELKEQDYENIKLEIKEIPGENAKYEFEGVLYDTKEEAEKAKEQKIKELTDLGYENINAQITEVPGENAKYEFEGVLYDTKEEAEKAKEQKIKELTDLGYENINAQITEVPGENAKYEFEGVTYDTKEEAEKAKATKEKELTDLGYENINLEIKEIAGENAKYNYAGVTYDTKEEAEKAKEQKIKELKDLGYENINLEIKEIAGENAKYNYAGVTYDTKEEAEKAKEQKIKELKDLGYENINLEIKEIAGENAKYEFNGSVYNTKEEAQKALEDFAKSKGGTITSSNIKENVTESEKVYETKTETIENSELENYKKDLQKKVDELNKKGDYRYEIASETISSTDVVLVVKSTTSDVKIFGTKKEAEDFIASLGKSTDLKIVETKYTEETVLDQSINEKIDKTFATELEAIQYIENLKSQGYDVSDLEKELLSFEESIWVDKEGVVVDPGTADGRTYRYGHLDITLITSFTKIDENGNQSKVNGTITISNVKVNNKNVSMSGPSKDPSRGDWEYTSNERQRLNITNKSLVEITGTVKYGNQELPFTISGYLSESQNVCRGEADSKGFDLKFKSITIVNNKVYGGTNLVTQYKVSGTATKNTYKTNHKVSYTVTEKEYKEVPTTKTQVTYTIYEKNKKTTYTAQGTVEVPTKDYVLSGTYEMPTKDYNLSGTYEVPTKDYNLSGTYEMPTKDYILNGTYEVPTKDYILNGTYEVATKNYIVNGTYDIPRNNYMLTVKGERQIIDENIIEIEPNENLTSSLPKTGDNNETNPLGLAAAAIAAAALASKTKRKTLVRR